MLSDGNFFKNAEDERDEKLSTKINQENIMYKSMLAFLLAISTFLWSEEPSSIHKEYVRPDQVIITESGIIAFLEENVDPVVVQQVAFDERGLFIVFQQSESSFGKGPCGLHDVWHTACGGCGVLFCPMNCTCFD